MFVYWSPWDAAGLHDLAEDPLRHPAPADAPTSPPPPSTALTSTCGDATVLGLVGAGGIGCAADLCHELLPLGRGRCYLGRSHRAGVDCGMDFHQNPGQAGQGVSMEKNGSNLLHLRYPRPHFPGKTTPPTARKKSGLLNLGRPDGKGRKYPGIGRRRFLAGDAFDPILPGEPGTGGPVHPGSCGLQRDGPGTTLPWVTTTSTSVMMPLRDYLRAMDGVMPVRQCRGTWAANCPIRPWAVHTLANGLRVGITGVVTDFVNVWEQPQNLERLRGHRCLSSCPDGLFRPSGTSATFGCVSTTEVLRKSWKRGGCSRTAERILPVKSLGELDFDLLLTGHQHMGGGRSRVVRHLCGSAPPPTPGQFLHITGQQDGRNFCFHSKTDASGCNARHGALSELTAPGTGGAGLAGTSPSGSWAYPISPEGKLDAAPLRQPGGRPVQPGAVDRDRGGFLLHQLGETTRWGLASPVTMRGVTAAYLFANTLVVLEVTEEVLRQTLERCAAYFTLVDGQPQISEEFSATQGGALQLRLLRWSGLYFRSAPPLWGAGWSGWRSWTARPLGVGTFRLCTSNYRATGTGGYDVLRKCPGPLARRRRNAGSHRPLYPDPQPGAAVA